MTIADYMIADFRSPVERSTPSKLKNHVIGNLKSLKKPKIDEGFR
ncbi:MAG: hypothetical protein OHK0019_24190 [Saprospiraceae bacterium]